MLLDQRDRLEYQDHKAFKDFLAKVRPTKQETKFVFGCNMHLLYRQTDLSLMISSVC